MSIVVEILHIINRGMSKRLGYIQLNFLLDLIERKKNQRPPDCLQQDEIVPIAEKIPRTWNKLANLTKLFQSHEIDDIGYSRVGEDESQKACTMLTRYIEREGKRQKLADALEKLTMFSLAKDVLSGYFISDQLTDFKYLIYFQKQSLM